MKNRDNNIQRLQSYFLAKNSENSALKMSRLRITNCLTLLLSEDSWWSCASSDSHVDWDGRSRRVVLPLV